MEMNIDVKMIGESLRPSAKDDASAQSVSSKRPPSQLHGGKKSSANANVNAPSSSELSMSAKLRGFLSSTLHETGEGNDSTTKAGLQQQQQQRTQPTVGEGEWLYGYYRPRHADTESERENQNAGDAQTEKREKKSSTATAEEQQQEQQQVYEGKRNEWRRRRWEKRSSVEEEDVLFRSAAEFVKSASTGKTESSRDNHKCIHTSTVINSNSNMNVLSGKDVESAGNESVFNSSSVGDNQTSQGKRRQGRQLLHHQWVSAIAETSLGRSSDILLAAGGAIFPNDDGLFFANHLSHGVKKTTNSSNNRNNTSSTVTAADAMDSSDEYTAERRSRDTFGNALSFFTFTREEYEAIDSLGKVSGTSSPSSASPESHPFTFSFESSALLFSLYEKYGNLLVVHDRWPLYYSRLLPSSSSSSSVSSSGLTPPRPRAAAANSPNESASGVVPCATPSLEEMVYEYQRVSQCVLLLRQHRLRQALFPTAASPPGVSSSFSSEGGSKERKLHQGVEASNGVSCPTGNEEEENTGGGGTAVAMGKGQKGKSSKKRGRSPIVEESAPASKKVKLEGEKQQADVRVSSSSTLSNNNNNSNTTHISNSVANSLLNLFASHALLNNKNANAVSAGNGCGSAADVVDKALQTIRDNSNSSATAAEEEEENVIANNATDGNGSNNSSNGNGNGVDAAHILSPETVKELQEALAAAAKTPMRLLQLLTAFRPYNFASASDAIADIVASPGAGEASKLNSVTNNSDSNHSGASEQQATSAGGSSSRAAPYNVNIQLLHAEAARRRALGRVLRKERQQNLRYRAACTELMQNVRAFSELETQSRLLFGDDGEDGTEEEHEINQNTQQQQKEEEEAVTTPPGTEPNEDENGRSSTTTPRLDITDVEGVVALLSALRDADPVKVRDTIAAVRRNVAKCEKKRRHTNDKRNNNNNGSSKSDSAAREVHDVDQEDDEDDDTVENTLKNNNDADAEEEANAEAETMHDAARAGDAITTKTTTRRTASSSSPSSAKAKANTKAVKGAAARRMLQNSAKTTNANASRFPSYREICAEVEDNLPFFLERLRLAVMAGLLLPTPEVFDIRKEARQASFDGAVSRNTNAKGSSSRSGGGGGGGRNVSSSSETMTATAAAAATISLASAATAVTLASSPQQQQQQHASDTHTRAARTNRDGGGGGDDIIYDSANPNATVEDLIAYYQHYFEQQESGEATGESHTAGGGGGGATMAGQSSDPHSPHSPSPPQVPTRKQATQALTRADRMFVNRCISYVGECALYSIPKTAPRVARETEEEIEKHLVFESNYALMDIFYMDDRGGGDGGGDGSGSSAEQNVENEEISNNNNSNNSNHSCVGENGETVLRDIRELYAGNLLLRRYHRRLQNLREESDKLAAKFP